tara:strand:+ start:1 stop:1197 length:1197 start_codon:yes stop_codon:yes gene_type:complete
MATAGGPKIVTDGLVFGYDTNYGVADNATGTRFYPGKAVDNEFYNSGPDGTMLDYVGYGGTGTARSGVLDALGTTDNIVYLKTGKLRFGPTGGDDIGTLYYGNTYTFSIYMRHVPGYTQMSGGEFDINDQSSGGKNYSGTLSSNMTYEWKRFSVTSTHTNSSNYHFIDIGTYQGTGVFEWCCPQIELGTIASPFTSTERSSTQSLIDLKETTDISMSNVSFDSTGQPEMDGSSDYIDLGADLAVSPINQGWTAEYVFNSDSAEVLQHFNGCEEDTHNAGWIALYQNKLQVWNRSPGGWYSGNTVFASNTWYHVAFVQESGTSMQFYVNGVAEGGSHTTYSWNADKSAFFARYIGRYENAGGYSRYFNGHIPVTRLYNKGLSAAEIKQNYNTLKNRFDI